ncbi:MAG: alpha/beta fold hydrolase [Halobacteria archaeon]
MSGSSRKAESGWIDRDLYPFSSNYMETSAGDLHYVDDGSGDSTVVLLHGNPTWSFLYRDVIHELTDRNRCIAPDLLGFGLSDRPGDFGYLPENHAEIIEEFLGKLDAGPYHLVLHDYGGPIGTSYAVKHPENVASMVPMNTFCWPISSFRGKLFSKIVGGEVGKKLIRNLDFFSNRIIKHGTGERFLLPASGKELSRREHRHYLIPTRNRVTKRAITRFPRELTESRDWFSELRSQLHRLQTKPGLVIWGANDPAFSYEDMKHWTNVLDAQEVVVFRGAGHYLQETHGREIGIKIQGFLSEI